jgi:hypothetical protein
MLRNGPENWKDTHEARKIIFADALGSNYVVSENSVLK